mgnify:CR=1 FL=1
MRLGQFFAQRFGDGARNTRRQLNFIERVSVSFKKFYLMQAQAQNLKAIRRLQQSTQRLGVKAIGDDGQLRDGTLQPINLKQSRRAEHGNAIECVVPEFAVAAQFLKRLQQRMNFVCRIFFFERLLQLFDEVPKAKRVLLIAGMMPMRRLIKRQAGRSGVSGEGG